MVLGRWFFWSSWKYMQWISHAISEFRASKRTEPLTNSFEKHAVWRYNIDDEYSLMTHSRIVHFLYSVVSCTSKVLSLPGSRNCSKHLRPPMNRSVVSSSLAVLVSIEILEMYATNFIPCKELSSSNYPWRERLSTSPVIKQWLQIDSSKRKLVYRCITPLVDSPESFLGLLNLWPFLF